MTCLGLRVRGKQERGLLTLQAQRTRTTAHSSSRVSTNKRNHTRKSRQTKSLEKTNHQEPTLAYRPQEPIASSPTGAYCNLQQDIRYTKTRTQTGSIAAATPSKHEHPLRAPDTPASCGTAEPLDTLCHFLCDAVQDTRVYYHH